MHCCDRAHKLIHVVNVSSYCVVSCNVAMRNYHVIIAGFALQRARTLQTPVVCNRTGIPA